MHIALITDGVHPYVIGGMQRHTYYLCKYLSRQGIKITLVHFNNGVLDIDKLEIFDEVEKKNIESIVIPFPESDNFPGHYVRASYKYSCLIFEKLKGRWNEFDFIYAKGFSVWKLLEEKNKAADKYPPIGLKFHGYEMFQKQADFMSLIKSYLLRRPVKWNTLNADYVFSYGSKITDIIRSLGVKENKIIEIPAGIDPSWINEKELNINKKRIFTYLGRYERRKGIEELNKAMTYILDLRSDFEFQFIGPFNEDQKLKHDNIKYFGSITDNEKIKSILDETDFLVCPSWSEGMPNVILEAMSRGAAIIGTDVGAVSVMLDSKNGYLIEPGNIKMLYSTLIKAIETDGTVLLSMKQESLNKIKNKFRYDIIIDIFLKRINHIINKK